MPRSCGQVFVEWMPMSECAEIDEKLHNGTGKCKPRRFLTCRQCGRRTRDINKYPETAFGWTVTPRRMTTCPECQEREPDTAVTMPERARANYRKEVSRVRHNRMEER